MGAILKAGTNFPLAVKFEDDHFSDIAEIEFIFKQTRRGEAIKTALWSRDGESHDAALAPDTTIVNVYFTQEDTFRFVQDSDFYMDTRIHYADTNENPHTPILKLRMDPTLFEPDGEGA